MKWLLRSLLVLVLVLPTLHALGMPDALAMQGDTAMQAHSGKTVPTDCVPQCLKDSHSVIIGVVSHRLQDLLPGLVLVVMTFLLVPLLQKVRTLYARTLARPPDLITLYAHYRI